MSFYWNHRETGRCFPSVVCSGFAVSASLYNPIVRFCTGHRTTTRVCGVCRFFWRLSLPDREFVRDDRTFSAFSGLTFSSTGKVRFPSTLLTAKTRTMRTTARPFPWVCRLGCSFGHGLLVDLSLCRFTTTSSEEDISRRDEWYVPPHPPSPNPEQSSNLPSSHSTSCYLLSCRDDKILTTRKEPTSPPTTEVLGTQLPLIHSRDSCFSYLHKQQPQAWFRHPEAKSKSTPPRSQHPPAKSQSTPPRPQLQPG